MNRLQALLVSSTYRTQFQQTSLGIEREDHRITETGSLALTPHPKTVDGSKTNPYIKRDFAESQLELVTPVCNNIEELMQWLEAIHTVTLRSLPTAERMWPDSMPPQIASDDSIQVAQFEDNPEAISYRKHLVTTYGKRLQMISGIHFNWGLDPALIQALYGELQPGMSEVDFQSELYLEIARKFLRWQWLIIYLFGATPIADASFYPEGADHFTHPVRSIRNSRFGYHNAPDVVISYQSLNDYVDTLEENVNAGRLAAEKELYSTVRLRGAEHARTLLECGIQYLEFRLFDIQSDQFTGISARDVLFLKYFALYLLYRDETVDDALIQTGIQRAVQVAEEDCRMNTAFQTEGFSFLDEMSDFLTQLEVSDEIMDVLSEMKERLLDPTQTPAAKKYQVTPTVEAWLKDNIEKANRYYETANQTPYILEGFSDMELSTQCLLFDAIQQGIEIDILDRADQFLRLRYLDHEEYVRDGNMTARDSLISYFKQGNKMVTKQIVQAAGFPIPTSVTLTKDTDSTAIVNRVQGVPVVVKPKATNMGVGISIFKEGADREALNEALDIAFIEDETVMIESFAPGTEYRFFVLDGEVKAVLLRVPANVLGDGQHTIQELVMKKNQDPLRGDNHRTPLTKIQLGAIEQLTLKQQGFTVDSIPALDQQVWLRENSNVSTGGDSIDVTKDMDHSYLEIASEIAKALDVAVTGLDLMIEDRHTPAYNHDGHANYTFIESNFNPMMMMHIYPAVGKGRRLTKDMLQFLFPEKTIK
ncbi:MAG: bifunctional glutamate--cysteine ligase GshA/glutathione synthetase GshB [Aerococcus sp.]|nr:bifunctional glutamate--cysteine ligase GshA/glutathione synthetase GshB [Aerococcus sp.]